jgi:hypothetical protein
VELQQQIELDRFSFPSIRHPAGLVEKMEEEAFSVFLRHMLIFQ